MSDTMSNSNYSNQPSVQMNPSSEMNPSFEIPVNIPIDLSTLNLTPITPLHDLLKHFSNPNLEQLVRSSQTVNLIGEGRLGAQEFFKYTHLICKLKLQFQSHLYGKLGFYSAEVGLNTGIFLERYGDELMSVNGSVNGDANGSVNGGNAGINNGVIGLPGVGAADENGNAATPLGISIQILGFKERVDKKLLQLMVLERDAERKRGSRLPGEEYREEMEMYRGELKNLMRNVRGNSTDGPIAAPNMNPDEGENNNSMNDLLSNDILEAVVILLASKQTQIEMGRYLLSGEAGGFLEGGKTYDSAHPRLKFITQLVSQDSVEECNFLSLILRSEFNMMVELRQGRVWYPIHGGPEGRGTHSMEESRAGYLGVLWSGSLYSVEISYRGGKVGCL